MSKKIDKLIKEDFEKTYKYPISTSEILSKIDFLDIQVEPKSKTIKDKAFLRRCILISLLLLILCISIISTYIITKHEMGYIENKNYLVLTTQEKSFFEDNSEFYYSDYDSMINLIDHSTLFIYEGYNKTNKVYFYKIIFNVQYNDITLKINNCELNINNDNSYGILYSFEKEENNILDMYITIDGITKHYYIEK